MDYETRYAIERHYYNQAAGTWEYATVASAGTAGQAIKAAQIIAADFENGEVIRVVRQKRLYGTDEWTADEGFSEWDGQQLTKV